MQALNSVPYTLGRFPLRAWRPQARTARRGGRAKGIPVTGLARFTEKLPSRSRPVVLTCVYGLGAGLAAVAFQVGMNTLYRLGIVRLSQASTVIFLLGSLVVIVTTSLAVGFLLTRFAPEASGSVLLASAIGAMVVHGLVGKQPAFMLSDVETSGGCCMG
jgi:hypothetical protein